MKSLVLFPIIALVAGCAKPGEKDERTYSDVTPCIITADTVTCGSVVKDIPKQECPVQEPTVVTETEIVEVPVIVEVPAAEPLPKPVSIDYHGVICNNVPVVSLGEERYVIYGNRLNRIEQGFWITVWEHGARHCRVKVNAKGRLKSVYQP